MIVYAVRYSNYEPPEIDSLWSTLRGAQIRRLALGGDWTIGEMTMDPIEVAPAPGLDGTAG